MKSHTKKVHRLGDVHNSGANRLVCPECGNDQEFYEVADGVVLTSRFIQNQDGTFSQDEDDSQIFGEVKLFCGDCSSDLTEFHKHFLEMLF